MPARTKDGVRETSRSKAWTEKWLSAEVRTTSSSYGVTALHCCSFLLCKTQGFLQLSSHSFWSHLTHLFPQYLHVNYEIMAREKKKAYTYFIYSSTLLLFRNRRKPLRKVSTSFFFRSFHKSFLCHCLGLQCKM